MSWHEEELSSFGLCYDVVKQRWFWNHASLLQEKMTRVPLSRACAKAARRLGKALQRCTGSEQDDHGAFAQWQEWLSMYLGETHEPFIDLDGILAELNIAHPV